MSDLEVLIKRRTALKGRLTRLTNFIDQFEDGDVEQLESRKPNLSVIINGYYEVQNDIELLDPTNKDDVEEFETRYYDAMSALTAKIKNGQTNGAAQSFVSHDSSTREHRSNHINVRLPVIDLPNFSGSYSEWTTFHDTFKALVHNNDGLDNCQKFFYLKSCLKGDALKCIDSIGVTSENYANAWLLLQKRYENKRLIVQEHINRILNLPRIDKASGSSLRQLLDTVNNSLAALEALQIPTQSWDILLITEIVNKLDYVTRKEWESSLETEVPSQRAFFEYLEKRCRVLESMNVSLNEIGPKLPVQTKQTSRFTRPRVVHAATKAGDSDNCLYCNLSHKIYHCDEFLKLNTVDRTEAVKKIKICFNCLRKGHMSRECRSSGCRQCGKMHNSLLHTMTKPILSTDGTKAPNQVVSNHCTDNQQLPRERSKLVLLSTASVLIQDSKGGWHKARCLLDQGSEICIASESLVKRLGLPTQKATLSISGINQATCSSTKSVKMKVKSRISDFSLSVSCAVLNKITASIPRRSFNVDNVKLLPSIILADPEFNEMAPVDVLIGAEHYFDIIGENHLTAGTPKLHFSDTPFGWLVNGVINDADNTDCTQSAAYHVSLLDNNLNILLQNFLSGEENITNELDGPPSEEIEQHFLNTHTRSQENGRFIVQLPFKNGEVKLGKSQELVVKRFLALERRLDKNIDQKEKYAAVIDEYLNSGYMEPIPENEINNPNVNFLAHSAVLKDSSTTSLRVVYDASMPTSNGLSLNDNLLVGPVLQDDLFTILTRFRVHTYAMKADISRMYLHILLDKKHTDYQRLVWRYDKGDPLKMYRLLTLTFGLGPSSYIATRCLRECANLCEGTNPRVAHTIRNNFYMDDLLVSVENREEVDTLQEDLTHVLGTFGFDLRKWISNKSQMDQLGGWNNSENAEIDGSKALGLIWITKEDCFKFDMKNFKLPSVLTKRNILATIGQCYDPLGFLSPFLITAKLIMKDTWNLKLGWDKLIPNSVSVPWRKFCEDLEHIEKFKVPRHVAITNKVKASLHTFADSSLKAYGSVVYLRTEDQHGKIIVHLVASKSRLAPEKSVTLPRLELCAAVLAVRLCKKVEQALDLNITEKYFWTDSMIVFHWISSKPSRWKIYVANRVAEIQRHSNLEEWRHVPSALNSADLITRGIKLKVLIDERLWLNGPEFLEKSEKHWPSITKKNPCLEDKPELLEERQTTVLSAVASSEFAWLRKYSSFNKLIRIIAHCLRWKYNTQNKNKPRKGWLSTEELNTAHNAIIRIVQAQEFPEEIACLQKDRNIKKSNKLLALDPFLDEQGLMRVGGRLKHSNLKYEQKFPLLLPARHHITETIIRSEHQKQLHAGQETTLACVRSKYWPISGRTTARKIIRSCVICFKSNPRPTFPKMGNLPAARTELQRAFLKVGLDFAGPFSIKYGFARTKKVVKAYMALFVCLATRAIHLELVGDLTVQSCLGALQRFVSRRGCVSEIYCDNATNFVGCKNEMAKISKLVRDPHFQAEANQNHATCEITWKFSPPRSPHFNGLAERMIRSVKSILKKIIGNSELTYEELYTFMTRAEAVINSRPLSPLSEDPNDLNVLTPAHFLIGESITAPAEINLSDTPTNRLSRWQYVENLRQHFWRRYHREVLSHMQSRSKWRTSPARQIQQGDMVLLVDDNLKPMDWKLGRVVDLHVGSDQKVRVVTVRTATGIYKRAVAKLCALPVES